MKQTTHCYLTECD